MLTLAQAVSGPSPSQATVYWIAAVLVLVGLGIILMVISTRIRGWRTAGADLTQDSGSVDAAQSVQPPQPLRLVPRQQAANPTTQEAQNLLRLMGEAEELCTRLGRDLDDKALRLERLLARAEGRLGPEPMGAAEVARVGGLPAVVSRPVYQPTYQSAIQGTIQGATQPVLQPSFAPVARPEIVTRPVAVPSVVGAAVGAVGVGGAFQQMRSSPDPFGLDPLSLEIYRLSDAGDAPNVIAQQLGQHTGKVELILALRSR